MTERTYKKDLDVINVVSEIPAILFANLETKKFYSTLKLSRFSLVSLKYFKIIYCYLNINFCNIIIY